MSVAAIIPCRNGEAYLAEALASVRAQTLPVDELIVVDDGSTDRSVDIARAAGCTVVAAAGPGGPAAARNVGWRHARSGLLAFLDADDRWLPHHCATLVAWLDAHPAAVLAYGGVNLFGLMGGQFPSLLPAGEPADASIISAVACAVPQMSVMIRRSALEAVGGYDEQWRGVEDFDLFARLALLGPFIAAPEITAEYRQHPGQTTRARRMHMLVASMQVRERHMTALRRERPADELADAEAWLLRQWRADLRTSWHEGAREEFDTMLAMAGSVLGSEADARRWRQLARWGWAPYQSLRWTWQALRIRWLLKALSGRGGTQMERTT